MKRVTKRSGLAGFFALLLSMLLWPAVASADVATYGAVLLDPFNPVPEIQFRHSGCDDGCGYRHHHRRRHCDDACDPNVIVERGPEDGPPDAGRPPCLERCRISEHWERNWRNGDRVGQEWYDRGYRERDTSDGHRPHGWQDRHADYDDEDDDAPPAAAAAPAAAPAAGH